MKQVSIEEWKGEYGAVDLVETFLSVEEFAERYGLTFEAREEPGLGQCFYAVVDIQKEMYLLQGVGHFEGKQPGVTIKMQGNNPSVDNSVMLLAKALNIESDQFKWVQNHYSKPRWILERTTAQGATEEITRFYEEAVALHNQKILGQSTDDVIAVRNLDASVD